MFKRLTPPEYIEFENDVIDKLAMFNDALSQLEDLKATISKMADHEAGNSSRKLTHLHWGAK